MFVLLVRGLAGYVGHSLVATVERIGPMLAFRMLCAVLMAWAAFWTLSCPEAADLLLALPFMGVLGPIAAAGVGFVNLASRQGWGVVVAVANGVWAGLLSIVAAGALYMDMVAALAEAIYDGSARDIGVLLHFASNEMASLLERAVDAPLVMLTVSVMAVLGVLTELLHQAMVRLHFPLWSTAEPVIEGYGKEASPDGRIDDHSDGSTPHARAYPYGTGTVHR